MDPFEAFDATWSQARSTMGAGTPQDGSGLDNSTQLRQLQSQVQAAAPNDWWTGQAADAYGTANDKQSQRLTRMAELDQQLGAEVNRSAQMVTAGRQNLDSIRQWVNDAAASLPDSENHEQKLLIARKGVSDVSDVVHQTHRELKTIGQRIRDIGQQYSAIDGAKPRDAFDLDTQFTRANTAMPGGPTQPAPRTYTPTTTLTPETPATPEIGETALTIYEFTERATEPTVPLFTQICHNFPSAEMPHGCAGPTTMSDNCSVGCTGEDWCHVHNTNGCPRPPATVDCTAHDKLCHSAECSADVVCQTAR